MLIHLDDTISQLGDDLTPGIIGSLEDVAAVVRAGTHIVTGNISTLRYLTSLDCLGISARSAFRGLANRYSQFASIKSMVTTFAEIVLSENTPTTSRRGDVDVISIPLAYVAQLNLRSPTEIIYEEIQDDFIYEIISRWYIQEKLSPGFLNRNYRPVHGGGGRTHAVYAEAQQRNNQFCLCVTDSDKKFPTDISGTTSTEVRAVNDIHQALSSHLDLDFHEVENLVPLSFLKEKCTSPTSQAIAEQIKGVDAAGFPEAKLFWDYKKGFSVGGLKQLNGGWDYWRVALGLANLPCPDTCTPQRCQCEVLKPWPEKRAVKEQIHQYAKMDPSECELLSSLWADIGGSLVSWCVSAMPKPA